MHNSRSAAGGTSSTSRARRRSRRSCASSGQTEASSSLRRNVRSRLNRLLNAEEANLERTVRAADRQLAAIARLEADGRLAALGVGLREAAASRRRMPEADLDTLATALGISRSAVNHRLRRLVELASQED
jgi:cell division protein WhiA